MTVYILFYSVTFIVQAEKLLAPLDSEPVFRYLRQSVQSQIEENKHAANNVCTYTVNSREIVTFSVIYYVKNLF
jgi:hypothetical protein